MSHLFAYLSRMKFIRRWGLMHNTYPENIQEHSLRAAMIAHALAIIRNRLFNGNVNPERTAVLALYHDADEVLTGDLPTPVKNFNPEISAAYKEVASNDPSQLTFQVITMPETAIKIRPAGPGDVDTIVRIYVDSWNAGFGPRMPAIEADAARIGRWRKELTESSATCWWLAERGDVVVGFVGIGPSRDPIDPDLGELDKIAVAPVAWRTGVGKALMAVALESLRSEGYHSAFLWTLSDYPQAESFYVATGWRLNGVTRRDGQEIRYDYEL